MRGSSASVPLYSQPWREDFFGTWWLPDSQEDCCYPAHQHWASSMPHSRALRPVRAAGWQDGRMAGWQGGRMAGWQGISWW